MAKSEDDDIIAQVEAQMKDAPAQAPAAASAPKADPNDKDPLNYLLNAAGLNREDLIQRDPSPGMDLMGAAHAAGGAQRQMQKHPVATRMAATGLGLAAMAPFAPEAAGYASMRGLGALAGRSALGAGAGAAGELGAQAVSGEAPDASKMRNAAGDMAKAELAGPALGKGLELGAKLAGAVGGGIARRAGQIVSGIKPASFNNLKDFGAKVMSYARMGMEVDPTTGNDVPKALLVAQDLGRKAQAHIEKLAEGAGKKFNGMMEYLGGAPEDAARFPVAGQVYDKMEHYIETQTPYRQAKMSETSKQWKGVFDDYYERIKSTLQEGMSPREAAGLLQEMTNDQRKYKGTGLSAHLRELKETLLDALPGEYSKSHEIMQPSKTGWNIAETRTEYRAAQQLKRDLKSYTKKENPLSAIDYLVRAGGKTKVALEKLSASDPEFNNLLNEIKIAKAGADFAPKISNNLMRTGLTGVAGYAASKLATSAAKLGSEGAGALAPVAAEGLAAGTYALGASPRAVGNVVNTANKMKAWDAGNTGSNALKAIMAAKNARKNSKRKE